MLNFDDGSATTYDPPCEWDPEGLPMGEYQRELRVRPTHPDSAVLFSADFATLETDITPTQVEFADTGSSQHAVFEVVGELD